MITAFVVVGKLIYVVWLQIVLMIIAFFVFKKLFYVVWLQIVLVCTPHLLEPAIITI